MKLGTICRGTGPVNSIHKTEHLFFSSRIQDLAKFWTNWDCRNAELVRTHASAGSVRFSFIFHRNRSTCLCCLFLFRRCWHSSCGQHFWHLQFWPSRLLGGATRPERDWRRQSSHQHREEAGKEQGHRWPYPQIRKSWRLLGFASAFLHRFLAAVL